MAQAVAYYRVSTRAQGRSALGLEAQKEAVTRFAEAQGITLLAEFLEGERRSAVVRLRPVHATVPGRAAVDQLIAQHAQPAEDEAESLFWY